MANYKIIVERPARKNIESIGSKKDRQAILNKIARLAENPYSAGAEKVKGGKSAGGHDIYRVRQGDYRILYVVNQEAIVVHVVKVGHRKEIYRRLLACYLS